MPNELWQSGVTKPGGTSQAGVPRVAGADQRHLPPRSPGHQEIIYFKIFVCGDSNDGRTRSRTTFWGAGGRRAGAGVSLLSPALPDSHWMPAPGGLGA